MPPGQATLSWKHVTVCKRKMCGTESCGTTHRKIVCIIMKVILPDQNLLWTFLVLPCLHHSLLVLKWQVIASCHSVNKGNVYQGSIITRKNLDLCLEHANSVIAFMLQLCNWKDCNPCIHKRIKIKWPLSKWDVRGWTGLNWLRTGSCSRVVTIIINLWIP